MEQQTKKHFHKIYLERKQQSNLVKFQLAYAHMLPPGEKRDKVIESIESDINTFCGMNVKEKENQTPKKVFASLENADNSPSVANVDAGVVVLEVGEDGLYPDPETMD